jgi:hypothetical protein
MEMKRETGFADSYFLSLWERTEVRAFPHAAIST